MKLRKTDVEYISKRFYDFHDKVDRVVKEMIVIKNEVGGQNNSKEEEVSLNHYCIARHDKNIVVAFYQSRYGSSQDIQFPLSYLYEEGWQTYYRNKLKNDKAIAELSREKYNKERDLNEIKRLRKLYPEQFK